MQYARKTSRLGNIKSVQHAGDSLVLVERSVLDPICATARCASPALEAGGILLGYRKGEHIQVMTATHPAALDERRRYSFFRRDPSHQAAASLAWKRSGHTMDWVGEWHSHLEPRPAPSSVDLATWSKQVRHRRQVMAYIIVGTSDLWLGLLHWGRKAPVVLQVVEAGATTTLFGRLRSSLDGE